jgi:hypothetical protein
MSERHPSSIDLLPVETALPPFSSTDTILVDVQDACNVHSNRATQVNQMLHEYRVRDARMIPALFHQGLRALLGILSDHDKNSV